MGYEDISIDDLMNFRQLGAKTAGHPECGHLAGIDMTTGPLGRGFHPPSVWRWRKELSMLNMVMIYCSHYTYVINGDGCLMEGISEEAISFSRPPSLE